MSENNQKFDSAAIDIGFMRNNVAAVYDGFVELESSTPMLARNLKTALRRFARSVNVVTCRVGEDRFAMTATAVCEISMAPPSMLVCVNRESSFCRPLEAGANFCVNVLHESQSEISQICGGFGQIEDRFGVGAWEDGPDRLPILRDAQANISCVSETSFVYGSHRIFIGKVIEVVCAPETAPLLYVDGKYASLRIKNEL